MSVAPKEGAETRVPEQMDPGAANSLLEQPHKIAVIIPCFNEGHSIAEVVRGFKSVLPSARIYVFDNNSTDETVAVASAAGALIRRENLQGKGNVVRSMFSDVGRGADVIAGGASRQHPYYPVPCVDRRILRRPLILVW